MTLVVDASALIAAFVDSQPEGEWADSLIASDELAGPELALAEATNILRRMELSGDLSRDKAAAGRLDLMSSPSSCTRSRPSATVCGSCVTT